MIEPASGAKTRVHQGALGVRPAVLADFVRYRGKRGNAWRSAWPCPCISPGQMSPVRSFLSIPALLVAMAGLAGCYDLSDPSGPRREDFMHDPSASEPNTSAQQQGEQAQAERSEQAAMAATKATTTASDPTTAQHALPLDATALPAPAGADLSVAEYVARYIHPAPSAD